MVVTVDMPPDVRAPAAARSVVRAFLRSLRILGPERSEDAVLLVSELVSNSLLHARRGRIRLRGAVDGDTVRVAVTDAGPGIRRRESLDMPTNGAPDGRGLPLVDMLADRWGDCPGPEACVWFELDASPSDRSADRVRGRAQR